MQSKSSLTESFIKCFVYTVLIIIGFMVCVALFSGENPGEASIGSFESESFSDSWTLIRLGHKKEVIDLPAYIEDAVGETLFIKKILPDDINDSTTLLTRTSLEDMYIYIDGELREHYASETIPYMTYYIPSAFIVTSLSHEDSGKELMIRINIKKSGILNEVRLSAGNNSWFRIFQNNLPVNIAALVVLLFGIIVMIFSMIQGALLLNSKSTFYLSLLMIDLSLWIFSESRLRQLIFAKPSLTSLFAYAAIEIITVLCCLYFDEVQHKKYHRTYVIIELVGIAILVANYMLHFAGLVELYRTIFSSHILMAVGLVVAVINVIRDFVSGRAKEYSAIAIGVCIFLAFSLVELLFFYYMQFYILGTFICIGVLCLMVSTLVQSLLDQVISSRIREYNQNRMIVNTIETIAGAIDAKDDYTGGHSERVGEYAAILARGMAADYNFSEEDIIRIHYIAVMHDIGKIGVADSVLNKPGKLTSIEYSLMKKHVEIGSELITGLDDSIEGIIDGIRYHHERFDGKGYPEGLSETEIPLIARIICLADCYDAMTSNRVYRKRLTDEEVRTEFIRCSGTQFDPALTDIFIRLMDSGDIHPLTVKGMTTVENGEVLKSVRLENYVIGEALSGKFEVKNRSHIRMVTYMMKLMEKEGGKYDIIILDVEEGTDPMHYLRNEYLEKNDIILNYHDNCYIIVMLNKDKAALEELLSMLSALSAVSIIKTI